MVRRRSRIGAIAGVGALISAGLFAGSALAPSPRAAATPKPNIVVIEVDDMRADELAHMTQTITDLPGTTYTKSSRPTAPVWWRTRPSWCSAPEAAWAWPPSRSHDCWARA